jgi:hypothetical protein
VSELGGLAAGALDAHAVAASQIELPSPRSGTAVGNGARRSDWPIAER